MSKDLRRCALMPGKLASIYALKLTVNPKLVQDKNTFYDSMATIAINSEPHMATMIEEDLDGTVFKYYTQGLAEVIGLTVNNLSTRYDNDNMYLPESANKLAKELESKIKDKISNSKVVDYITPEVQEVQKGKTLEEVDYEEHGDLNTYFNKLKADRVATTKGNLTVFELYKKYFDEYPDLAVKFKSEFINEFSNQLIDRSEYGDGYNEDINEVLELVKEVFDERSELAESYTKEDILSTDEAMGAFFAKVISAEFDSVVEMFLPGVKVDSNNLYEISKESSSRRTFSTYDGAFSGFDQTSDVMKMHIYTTPRLVKIDGEWVQDVNKPYLKEYEVKSVVSIMNSLPADLEGFRTELGTTIEDMSDNMSEKSILKSIYDKFFSDGSVIDNGKSFYDFIANGVSEEDPNFMLQNILSALIVDLRSKQSMEHVIVNNGKTVITKTQNANVGYKLEGHFESSITKSTDPTVTNDIISSKLEVLDNNQVKVYTKGKKGIILKFEEGKIESGIPVFASKETKELLNDINNANSVLQTIGFPSYLTTRFLNDYKTRVENSDLDLANMVANMVFMVASNDPKMHESFGDIKLHETLSSQDINTLRFKILDTAYGFKESIIKSAEEVEGIGANKVRVNGDGNIVATTGVRSRLYDTPNMINRLSEIDNTVHSGNVFVKGDYNLEGFYAKDGIKMNGVRKGNSSMTLLEQHKYLIEDTFLKSAFQSKFNSALIQPGVMSDRSVVDLALISSTKGEFLPIDSNGKLDSKSLKDEMYEMQKYHHNANSKVIRDGWYKFMLDRGLSTEEATKYTSDLNVLNDWVDTNKITYNEVSKSKLVDQLMYVKQRGKVELDGKKVTVVRLKQAFLRMHDIFNNKNLADKFFERNLSKFKSDLEDEGFTYSSLSPEGKKILKERFPSLKKGTAFNALIEGYFYHNNTLSNSIMNLNMGSIYQFKGDINLNEILDNPYFQDINSDGSIDDSEVEAMALDIAINNMFVTQSKRNAGLGSGFQHPRLADPTEKGKFLDTFTNTAVIADEDTAMEILGNISNHVGQEVYDASMLGHPLYFLKLNHSLGNNMSGFTNQGGAIKDISNELDEETGILRFQKKATFNIFSNEILRTGSPKIQRLFSKMNRSIKFPSGTLDLTGKEVNNMEELWISFGGVDQDNSWELVLNYLSERPNLRNLYVEKVGFVSGEKSGNRSINTQGVWEGSEKLKYTPFDNRYHGVILNSHHDYDTNASDLGHHKHDNEVSLITQIISAAAFEGNTPEISEQINQSIEALTDISINEILAEINSSAISILVNRLKSPSVNWKDASNEDIERGRDLITDYVQTNDNTELLKFIEEKGILDIAKNDYSKKLTEKALATRDAFSDTTDLLKSGSISMDSAQLYSTMHSSILSAMNKRTVKMKFKGGQFVVSASNDFIQLYRLPGSNQEVTRQDYFKSDLVPEEELRFDDLANYGTYETVKLDGELVTISELQSRLGKGKDIAKAAEEGRIVGKKIGQGRNLKWIQYNSDSGIKNSKGERITNVTQTDEYQALIDNADKIQSAKGAEKTSLLEERKSLEIAFRKVMEDSDYNWKHKKAEFYMPMIHQSRYNLDDKDTLGDIMGNYEDNDSEEAFQHRVEFFTNKVLLNSKKYKLFKYNNLEGITEDSFADLEERLENKLRKLSPDSIEFDYLKSELSILNSYDPDIDSSLDNLLYLINSNRADHKKLHVRKIAEIQAKDFPRTLDFLTARIPAQGKQSYMAGIIKGFINSNQNAIYGPAEMLAVTGADHDIDKANIMAYSVDELGAIYDYTPYLNDGKISRSKFNAIVKSKQQAFIDNTNGEVNSTIVQQRLDKILKEETHKFREATKNFLLDKLMESVYDPLNAVEAAHPMSMDTLKGRVDKNTRFTLDSDGRLQAFDSSFTSAYNPASKPVLELINSVGKEMIGIYASGIKGYAAIYSSAINDADNSLNNYNELKSDLLQDEDPSSQYLKTLERYFTNNYGPDHQYLDNNVLTLFLKDGTPITSKGIANISPATSLVKGAKTAYKVRLDEFSKEFPEGTPKSVIVKAFDEKTIGEADRILIDNSLSEVQAWAQISELLSAATDNAKELILGKIGANGDTGGMMTAGLVLGFDLDTTLDLFDRLEVKKFFKDLEDSRDLVKNLDPLYVRKELSSKLKDLKQDLEVNTGFFESEITRLEKRLGSIEVGSYNDLKQEIGEDLGHISEVSFLSPKGLNKSIDNYGIRNKSLVNSKPTSETIEKIKYLLGLRGVNPTDKVIGSGYKLGAIYNTIKQSNNVIIAGEIKSDEQYNLIISAAQEDSKPIYMLGYDGNWSKFAYGKWEKSIPAVISSKTALFSSNETSPGGPMDVAMNRALELTSSIMKSENEYNSFVESSLGEIKSKINDLKSDLDLTVKNYLTNGLRQLNTLYNAAEELKLINSMVLNQGLPNADWEVHKFFSKIVDKSKALDSITQFKDFINSYYSKVYGQPAIPGKLNDGGLLADELIKKAEINKTAFNPLQVIVSNKHYLSYIKAVMVADEMVKSSGFMGESIDYIIERHINPEGNNPVLDNKSFNSVKQFLYSITIEDYFSRHNITTKVGGKEYKLYSRDERGKFMEEATSLVEALQNDPEVSDNLFVQKLRLDLVKDFAYQSNDSIIKVNGMFNMDSNGLALLKISLNKLKDSHPEEYAALFQYSLILNKGARGNSSFASLFDNNYDGFKNYLDTLKGFDFNKLRKVTDHIYSETVLLSNPESIKTISTRNVRVKKSSYDGSFRDAYFSMPRYNKEKPVNLFKSRETGKIYSYHSKEVGYVVITPIFNTRFMPFTYNSMQSDILGSAGYVYGEKAKINEEGDTVQVLKYIKKMGYLVQDGSDTMYMSAQELSKFNKDMVFRGSNFGKISSDELSNPLFSRVRNPRTSKTTLELESSKTSSYQNPKEENESFLRHITVKKDDSSKWQLTISDDGTVTNSNTGKVITDEKLVNKAKLKSKYYKYQKVEIKSGTYAATNDGKIINITPGSKSNGNEISSTSPIGVSVLKAIDFDKLHKEPITYTDNLGKRYSSKKVSKEVMKRVFNRVNGLINGEARLLSSKSIETIYGKRYADKSGFLMGDNVVINIDKATLDTPIHEIGGHIYLRNLKNNDIDMYNELTQMASEHEMSNYIKRVYPELSSTQEIGEEVFATLLGLESQGKLGLKDSKFLDRIKSISEESESFLDFLKRLIKYVFGITGDFELKSGDTLMEIIDNLNDNIIFGSGSALKNVNLETKNLIRNSKEHIKSESDIEARLLELGFIKNICR